MKPILYLSIIYFFCKADCTNKYNFSEYTIKNNSGVVMEIIPYIRDTIKREYKVILTVGESINIRGKAYGSYDMRQLIGKNSIPGTITKVEFVFNNTSKIIYEDCSSINNCNAQARNPFNRSFNNEPVEEYIITAEDYANAIPCNGNCY